MMTDGNWTSRGDYFVIYKNIESLCCIPETIIILQVNYTLIKKKTRKSTVIIFFLALQQLKDIKDMLSVI